MLETNSWQYQTDTDQTSLTQLSRAGFEVTIEVLAVVVSWRASFHMTHEGSSHCVHLYTAVQTTPPEQHYCCVLRSAGVRVSRSIDTAVK